MASYKDSGVDIERGNAMVEMIKERVHATHDKNVLTGLGSFGAMYSLEDFKGMSRPVLVSGADGVGTKLKIAFAMDKHDTVGIDCVAMNVDDVVCQGAKPLFFLDYIATGKLEPEKMALVVGGIAEGCKQAGCALVGGETAEMPGFYPDGEYDLAGFCVGIADGDKLVNGADIRPGDALIGLASSGMHSNGFALARAELVKTPADLNVHIAEFGHTMGEELLTPTRIYAKSIMSLLDAHPVKGITHITGGGFIENIPRMFPKGLGCSIRKGSWPVLPVFDLLVSRAALSDHDAYSTLNMGIGMVLAVDSAVADALVRSASACGEKAYIIGEVTSEAGVTIQ